jgi:hypothetical protein
MGGRQCRFQGSQSQIGIDDARDGIADHLAGAVPVLPDGLVAGTIRRVPAVTVTPI